MDYRNLIAWQKSMDLAEQIYRETAFYPVQERYGMTAQMRRAAISIPSNVAEGQGRRSTDDEFIRFLQIALGSLCELETQLELSSRLKLITPDRAKQVQPSLEEVGRLLNGLIKSKRHS
jgi:four helix bundle protein